MSFARFLLSTTLEVASILLIYLGLSWGLAYLWDWLGFILPAPLYNAESLIIFFLLRERLFGFMTKFYREAIRYERQRNV